MDDAERHDPRQGLKAELAIVRVLKNGKVILVVIHLTTDRFGRPFLSYEPILESLQILN